MEHQNNNNQMIQKQQIDQDYNQRQGNGQCKNNYFKNFKQQLVQRYGNLSQQKLLQKLIDSQIKNKQLSTRLAQMEPFKQKNLRPTNKQKSKKLFEQFQTQKFALKICYLGHLYDGMALQFETQNTVQQYLFKCMNTLNLIQSSRPGADYTRAGRTDKGVSAMGNVISLKLRTNIRKNTNHTNNNQNKNQNGNFIVKNDQFQTKNGKLLHYCDMMNSLLPQDIKILACQPVAQQFNARYWCKQRSYKYFFVKNNLNIDLMKKAIKSFEGKHNFINFCKMNLSNTVNFQRQIMRVDVVKVQNQFNKQNSQNYYPLEKHEKKCQIDDRNDVYYFHYVGNSFLWHQIRFMSSALFMVGQGSQPVSIIQDLLNIQKYPCKPNYTMAPEYPLILQDCLYDNLQFKPNPQTIYRFYNTFHEMISKNTIYQTLIVNCMHLAKRDLMANIKISQQAFIKGVLQNYKRTVRIPKKSMQLHKASGRCIQQAIKSLKGKKKELYQKKALKQAQFEQKQKERLQKQKIENRQNKDISQQ